ncbi:MAG: FMN-binding protein [Bilifractor sp.]
MPHQSKSTVRKRMIDIILSIFMVILMSFQVVGGFWHEWIGIAMTVLVVVHNILNRVWYKNLFKGKYNPNRILLLVINAGVFASFFLTAFSGMAISKYAVPFMQGILPNTVARTLHLAMSYWSMIFVGMHLGMHWGMVLGLFGVRAEKWKRIVFEAVGVMLAALGLFLFIHNKIYAYIAFQSHFAMYYDPDKSAVMVFLENIFMFCPWIFVSYICGQLLRKKEIGHYLRLLLVFILISVAIVFFSFLLKTAGGNETKDTLSSGSAVSETELSGSSNSGTDSDSASSSEALIGETKFQDGVFEGTGKGYRGDVKVRVTVKDGKIESIDVTEYEDDKDYMQEVIDEMIPAMIRAQDIKVDTVSGATFSSNGVTQAVENALSMDNINSTASSASVAALSSSGDKESSASSEVKSLSDLQDGEYVGSGTGFRGDTKVSVTVKDHQVESVHILSYYDNEEYLFRIAPAVISEVTEGKELTVDTISGATYSTNGLTSAIENALGVRKGTYTYFDAKPRKKKDKKQHHYAMKTIDSEEEYQELVQKYSDVSYDEEGRLIEN